MSKVLGFEHVNFNFPDGKQVGGWYLYLHDTDNCKNVEGIKTERIFLSDQKAGNNQYMPQVNQTVRVYYNRYGKVDAVIPCADSKDHS